MKLRFAGQCLVAASLIYAAFILGTVVQEVRKIRVVLPEMLTQIERIEQSAQIPKILQQTQKVLADLNPWLTQVKAGNDQIPAILQEVAATRAIISPVLKESSQIRDQLDRQLPLVLQEVKAVREEAPGLLDKADSIVKQAKQISEKSGEAAAVGVLKGIFSAPLKILKDSPGSIKDLIEKE